MQPTCDTPKPCCPGCPPGDLTQNPTAHPAEAATQTRQAMLQGALCAGVRASNRVYADAAHRRWHHLLWVKP